MTPEKQIKKLTARITRAALQPRLWQSLTELELQGAGLEPASFLTFLSELAQALLKYRSGSRAQRRELRRIAFQPAPRDAEFLHALLCLFLQTSGPLSVPIQERAPAAQKENDVH